MQEVWLHNKDFISIGDAIREKLDTETEYTIEDMAPAIDSIMNEIDENSDIAKIIEGSITELNINMPHIGSYILAGCTLLTTVNLPVTTIVDEGAFSECSNLSSVSLPEATDIYFDAFYNCASLSTIIFPEVTSVGRRIITGTAVTSISMPKLTTVSYDAFGSCNYLRTVDLPEATTIESMAFSGCGSLRSVNIPKATSIEYNAFGSCSALTTIELPSVTSIGSSAFTWCSNLTSVILSGPTVCDIYASGVFNSGPIARGTGYIYVPAELVDTYKATANWAEYANQIVAISE